MEQGASSTRPSLPRVSPMATSSPSRQHRQHRLLQALRASSAHFCRRERRGEAARGRGDVPSPGRSPQRGCGGSLGGLQPPGAGRGAGGAYEGSRAEVTGQQQGRDSTGDGLGGSTGRSARSSACLRDAAPIPGWNCPWKLIQGAVLHLPQPHQEQIPEGFISEFALERLVPSREGETEQRPSCIPSPSHPASPTHPSLIPTPPHIPSPVSPAPLPAVPAAQR